MKNFFLASLFIGFLMIFGVFTTNAQTNLLGSYKFTAKDSIDNNPDNYAELFVITVEIKEKNQAVMTKTKSEVVEIEKKGSWSWNKASKLLTVSFPAAKNAEAKLIKK